ncbi:MAG: type II secretion system protein [Vulcanimicrobiota bacterium]
MRSLRGVSLLELMVALGLLACVIPLLVNLLPSSMISLRRAERLQVATTLAAYRMDEASLLSVKPGLNLDEEVALPPHRYRVAREFYAVGSDRVDVVVTVLLLDSNFPPIRLASRIERSGSR